MKVKKAVSGGGPTDTAGGTCDNVLACREAPDLNTVRLAPAYGSLQSHTTTARA